MANAAMKTTTNDAGGSSMSGLLPVDPYRSLYVHFGMLLGVDDFATVDAYHRGKMWLHSAWLHREGAVWGLRVSLDYETGEIRVGSGLAIDALGRELHLDIDACLNVGRWYEEHKDDAELQAIVTEDPDGSVHFDAHVVIQFKGCLARQVPALSEPCDGSGATTAYSRVVETVELLLIPGPAPQWRETPGLLPYHRLRLLFGLEDAIEEDSEVIASDQAVLDRRDAILALPVEQQPAAYLDAFRDFSALDEMDLKPDNGEEGDLYSRFPRSDPAPLPLADITGIGLAPIDSGWVLTSNEPDNTVRPVHVATSTIQELLCGPMCRCEGAGEGGGGIAETISSDTPTGSSEGVPPLSDAGGPRVDPKSVESKGEKIEFKIIGRPLRKASVDARGVSVSSFQVNDGWIEEDIQTVSYDTNKKSVRVQLKDAPEGNLVRLIVKGTGPFPFLGTNSVPLAGAAGGAPGTAFDGNDFVSMFKMRS